MGVVKWMWLGFLMGVVIFFKGGCGQAKKASTGSGQHFNVRFGGIILS